MTTNGHRFRFLRAGGVDQVLLDRGEDLLALERLDPKLWVTLSCPAQGLEFDENTLKLVDTDGDGRVRVPEILAAVRWATSLLRDPGRLVVGGDRLPLDAIRDDHPEGKAVRASALRIVLELGRGDEEISLSDAAGIKELYARMRFNGDGVLPPSAAEDEGLAAAIEEIAACMGGVPDRSGEAGVTKAGVEAFFEAAVKFDAGWRKAETDAAKVVPLGPATAEAQQALDAVRKKVDDWFTRSRLAAFDPRAEGPLNRSEEEYAAVAAHLLSISGEEVASFPLARVTPGAALPLVEGINPAWADRIDALRVKAIDPLLGPRTKLTLGDWRELVARLAPFQAWSAAGATNPVRGLGIERVRTLLGGDVRAKLLDLIAQDRAVEPETNGVAQVEKLLRFQRDLYTLLCNFVSFSDFYSKGTAVFLAGTLYLDGRSCELCIRVSDPAAHAAIATQGNTFLVYCDCVRRSDGRKMTIAAAITGGDAKHLAVGRNGIFFDRDGMDWDATVVRLVEHPIGIREAFWLPYQRIGKLIGAQIERFAAARDRDLQDRAAANLEQVAKEAESATPAEPKAQAFDVAKFAGVFAAIGLAIGAIGSTLAAVTSGFLNLAWWKMPLAVLGVIVLISGPSMAIAWLKLRRRSIGPLLDANGWAVNARAKIDIRLGASLTRLAALPAESSRTFAQAQAPRRRLVTAAACLVALAALAGAAWWTGWAQVLWSAASAD